jgi:hypothetical protein
VRTPQVAQSWPLTDADIFENERVYRANGLSGCCNSFDGFHVVWTGARQPGCLEF